MSRTGILVTLFVAVSWAHVLLPGWLPFALVLPCLCALASLWAGVVARRAGGSVERGGPSGRSGSSGPGDAERGMPLDDELALLEAEVHALRDQHLTRLQADGQPA